MSAPCSLGSCSNRYSPFVSLARTRTTSPGVTTPFSVEIFAYSEFTSEFGLRAHQVLASWMRPFASPTATEIRSEERRVGKEGRVRWWARHLKKKEGGGDGDGRWAGARRTVE